MKRLIALALLWACLLSALASCSDADREAEALFATMRQQVAAADSFSFRLSQKGTISVGEVPPRETWEYDRPPTTPAGSVYFEYDEAATGRLHNTTNGPSMIYSHYPHAEDTYNWDYKLYYRGSVLYRELVFSRSAVQFRPAEPGKSYSTNHMPGQYTKETVALDTHLNRTFFGADAPTLTAASIESYSVSPLGEGQLLCVKLKPGSLPAPLRDHLEAHALGRIGSAYIARIRSRTIDRFEVRFSLDKNGMLTRCDVFYDYRYDVSFDTMVVAHHSVFTVSNVGTAPDIEFPELKNYVPVAYTS